MAPGRVSDMVARWRKAGYVAAHRLGPGPTWCWLTRDGMTATGLEYPAIRPTLGRLAHIRAVLAARLWLARIPAWEQGQPWWHSERRLRAHNPAAGRGGHVPDAEIHWASIAGSPYAGQVWAVEVELTPKSAGRAARIMAELYPVQYAHVVYLTAPARPAGRRPRRRRPGVQRAGPGGRPGAARDRVPSGAAAMTVWSWLRLTLYLWLLRKAVKVFGWLLLLAVAFAVWPVTLVTAIGYGTAWAST